MQGVEEMLDKILELQTPQQREIREKMKKREARQNLIKTCEAQILTIAV